MKKVYGVSFSFSSFEDGNWFDSDERYYQPEGWGLKFDIVVGKMIRPVPKFWEKGNNPWKGDEPWFVIRIPFFIFPFLSICFRRFGFYIGCKVFEAKDKHRDPNRYGLWMREEEFGTDENPAEYLQLTATTRTTRWK